LNKTNEFLIRKEYKKWIDEGWKKFDFNPYTDFNKNLFKIFIPYPLIKKI
tara:strand:+ start:181 stop:330 length:150 start_codon:yes stop_codon:yes gene_type:complete